MSYTHSDHAKRCVEAAQRCEVLRQYVQVKLQQTSVCARITGCWTTPDRLDLWNLELLGPVHGMSSATVHRVRQCSGIDGRCLCAGEGEDRAALAPHESKPANRGTVLVPSMEW